MTDRFKKKGVITGIAAGIILSLGASWLFYDFGPFSVVTTALVPFTIHFFKKREAEKKETEYCFGFKEALQLMKNSMDAGYSAERSFTSVVAGLAGLFGIDADITVQFNLAAVHMSVGTTVEQAFADISNNTGIKEIGEFSEIFPILKRTGGDLNVVIRRWISRLNDKMILRRELRVAVASKQNEFNIMSFIPFGILIYMRLCSPEMVEPLYRDLFGKMFMTAMLALYGICFLWGHRIITKTINR